MTALSEVLAEIFSGMAGVAAEVAAALGPLVALFLLGQLSRMRVRLTTWVQMSLGFLLAGVGLTLFLQGVEVTYVPLGEELGRTLAGRAPFWLVPIGFLLGMVATAAEPAVHILRDETEKASSGAIPGGILLIVLAIGVGLSVAAAMMRTITGIPLWYILAPGYAGALLLARYVRRDFVAVAFDSGGVATGPMTVTFIVALSLGAAAAFPGRDPLQDGFGLVALVALAPILSVLTFGAILGWKERAPDASRKDESRSERSV